MSDQADAFLVTLGMPANSPWTSYIDPEKEELFLDYFHLLERELITVNAIIEATAE